MTIKFISRIREKDGKANFMIDFPEMIRVLVKNIFIIALCMIIFMGVAFLYGTKVQSPYYSAWITANVKNMNSEYTVTSLSAGDMESSTTMALSYAELVGKRSAVSEVLERAQVPFTYEDTAGAIACQVVEETPVIKISVSMSDPWSAYLVASAIAQEGPAVMENLVRGSSMEIVDMPVLPAVKSGPNIMKLMVVGGVAGAFLAIFGVLLLAFTGKKIEAPEDVYNQYGYEVIGIIPD